MKKQEKVLKTTQTVPKTFDNHQEQFRGGGAFKASCGDNGRAKKILIPEDFYGRWVWKRTIQKNKLGFQIAINATINQLFVIKLFSKMVSGFKQMHVIIGFITTCPCSLKDWP